LKNKYCIYIKMNLFDLNTEPIIIFLKSSVQEIISIFVQIN
jgi:hypothetical protein